MRILYSKELYSKEALLKAAYHFTDNYYIYLGVEDDSFFVDFSTKDDSSVDSDTLQNQFKNEILAQVIHQSISNETSDLRKLLVARALSSTMVDEEEDIPHSELETMGVEALNELSAIAKDWYDGK